MGEIPVNETDSNGKFVGCKSKINASGCDDLIISRAPVILRKQKPLPVGRKGLRRF
jgi:hypothetical protein